MGLAGTGGENCCDEMGNGEGRKHWKLELTWGVPMTIVERNETDPPIHPLAAVLQSLKTVHPSTLDFVDAPV